MLQLVSSAPVSVSRNPGFRQANGEPSCRPRLDALGGVSTPVSELGRRRGAGCCHRNAASTPDAAASFGQFSLSLSLGKFRREDRPVHELNLVSGSRAG